MHSSAENQRFYRKEFEQKRICQVVLNTNVSCLNTEKSQRERFEGVPSAAYSI